MASVTASLALKATTIVVVIAMMVFPSLQLGLYPPLGRSASPPPPAQPTPCNHCLGSCFAWCAGTGIPVKCHQHCTATAPCSGPCDNHVVEQCWDTCNKTCPNCMSAPPPPPTPTPPPPPPSLPPKPCNNCLADCYVNCSAAIPEKCSEYCNPPGCSSCKTQVIEQCNVRCSTCDCDEAASSACASSCSTKSCAPCTEGYGQSCLDSCTKDCANCVQ